ncbi:hypothetical protein QBL02_04910 [Leucobacter sp. UT-8R-CII-1-4]|uniref:hypothetical protein n=1 Tax=Leucobacter sp. UT-8R-CII-1-4 TaxID=3040075 RepID=UPI0024A7E2B0|nr:hypothetical protein [Leucobacter sp. UT-8R-CII-1-4]MDI6022880.1 hypothetical protein [Leucobacter sp. UT-8R-CII-1-4]
MWANIVNIVLGFVGSGLAIVLVTGVLATGAAVTSPSTEGGSAATGSRESAETSEAEMRVVVAECKHLVATTL